jgi:ADP-dependent NAD(P)H-hydrate dehydratase / NAD(P)H-hydrate epimerase
MASIQGLVLEGLIKSLPKRSPEANKGSFGRILVVGGDVGMSGAVHMAGEAALRVGAGLVKIATHPQHAATLNVARPELMVRPVFIPDELTPLLDEATHLILGPGLGQTPWSEGLWSQALRRNLPLLLDADGLNLLAKQPRQSPDWILTPHPGEAARLLNITPEAVQADRSAAIRALQKKYQGIVVLKGHHTLICDGGEMLYQCDQGNPGMATAGMGDILSGVIGGLMPQCDSLLTAACLGVCLHAAAGDLAATSGERGLIATDLYPFLQKLLG